jgi:Holliday junction resolvase RusA-like endonuclease
VHITVYGIPRPQGSKRSLGVNAKTGKNVIVDANARVREWRRDVMDAAREVITDDAGFQPFTGPLQVFMVFTFMRPPSVPRRKRSHPAVKPDVVKLARATEDALTAAGVWIDDALVVDYGRLAKVYAGEDPDALTSPGCSIEIYPMAQTIDAIGSDHELDVVGVWPVICPGCGLVLDSTTGRPLVAGAPPAPAGAADALHPRTDP